MSSDRFSDYCNAAEAFEKAAQALKTAARTAGEIAPRLAEWWKLDPNNSTHWSEMPSGADLRNMAAAFQHARMNLCRAHEGLQSPERICLRTPDEIEARFKG
jgi:hypothetical protein